MFDSEEMVCQIIQELDRLGLGTNHDPEHGIRVELVAGVWIQAYDDHQEIEVNGLSLLNHLQTLEPGSVRLHSGSPCNAWDLLAAHEAEEYADY